MKKQDWIDVVKLQLEQTWNWSDWTLFIVSVVSPIIMLISVIFAWKATKIARDSLEINFKMFEQQREDFEQSFLPTFEVHTIQVSSDIIRLKLINKNNKLISFKSIVSPEDLEVIQPTGSQINLKILGDFKSINPLKITLNYDTLNHKNHTSNIELYLIEGAFEILKHDIMENG